MFVGGGQNTGFRVGRVDDPAAQELACGFAVTDTDASG